MAAPDPLAVLQRLRGLEVALARRDLAERGAQAAAAAIPAEGRAAEGVDGHAAFAAWLPYGTAMRESRATEARLAAAALEAAREALVTARTAERVVELAREAKAEAARHQALRKAQAALDEIASQKRFFE
ncbi:hypothetical protein NON00_18825 [Roseomonas sp. GC11]|uniref:hypothetical protein n=1 Tax=Roseomonas sp. GC11 TaxID=2950546 RepID=UPI00210B2B2F|nr:hypothetical protein [Roseomonas sp. GC11]MCQ4161973.1 hypothetical protein [Roseomonas sp. GC11]